MESKKEEQTKPEEPKKEVKPKRPKRERRPIKFLITSTPEQEEEFRAM